MVLDRQPLPPQPLQYLTIFYEVKINPDLVKAFGTHTSTTHLFLLSQAKTKSLQRANRADKDALT